MSTRYQELCEKLAAAFDRSEIRYLKKGGKEMPYVTARVVMNRLDETVGMENWWDEYTPGEHAVQCRLSIRLPDGSVITKADAGAYAGMPDSGDDEKSGYSDAFKRAAVKFGIGRFLYNDGVPIYEEHNNGEVPNEPMAPAKPKPDTKVGMGAEGRAAFQKWLDKALAAVHGNDKESGLWEMHWNKKHDMGLAVPDPLPPLKLNKYSIMAQLLNTAVENEWIDPAVIPEQLTHNHREGFLAQLYHNEATRPLLKGELKRYVEDKIAKAEHKIYADNPSLAPDGWLEEQAELAARANADYQAPEPKTRKPTKAELADRLKGTDSDTWQAGRE
jgi:hypothetical protein